MEHKLLMTISRGDKRFIIEWFKNSARFTIKVKMRIVGKLSEHLVSFAVEVHKLI